MPWQLIYTSAPRGLSSGQTGFCTVARSGELREALAQRLEQLSYYHYLRVAEATVANRNPTVCAFRILDLRGTKYHVLTRIQPCGLDFTARTNYLAHHLVFQGNEPNQLPSPAAILRSWNGWMTTWQGDPRILEDPSIDSFGVAGAPCLPAQTWLRVTGDAGRAAGLLEGECVRGCYLVCPEDSERQVLDMFCETLQLLNLKGEYPLRPWRHPFTTFLQGEDNPADFHWRACQEGTPAHQQAVKRTATLVPLRSVRVPANSLVKVARAGLKPPPPPPEAGPTDAILALRKRETSTRQIPPDPVLDPANWPKPAEESPPSDDRSITISPAMLTRLGVFVAVLLILFGIKHFLKRNPPAPSVPPTAPVSSEPSSHAPNSGKQPQSTPTAALDVAQLDRLSGDGPTYLFATTNLNAVSLPIEFVIRFQNLIQRFDLLETRPPDIQLSLNTDEWGFTAGAPMTVHSRETQALSAQTSAGIESVVDYSNWKGDSHNPVAVRTSFSTPPNAFSLHFGFSAPDRGEPFRLLIVNENNAPAPLRLGARWLRAGGQSFASSLQPPLAERLLGNFMLPPGAQWQLRPFVGTPNARQAHYLYKDWPPDELPPPGDELDFATVKQRVTALLAPLAKKAAGLSERLAQQTKDAGFDHALGKDLGLTNRNLASLAKYAAEPSPSDFIGYLNALKKHAGIQKWPRLYEDDDEMALAAKFQQLHDLWPSPIPGTTNYFSAVWQNLKGIDKIRQEKRRVQDNIDKIRGRLSVVPDTPEQAAYVGLFIVDTPKPDLEMIRFEGP